jgi:dTMP kinase
LAGVFITIEGSDGSGKTTQIKLLTPYLKSLGLDVVITREPGGTVISEKIRDLILDVNNKNMAYITEAMLYAASRAQLVEEIIRPALDDGKVVICDRFVDSSLVYQGIARQIGIEKVLEINQYALNGLLPDITFFLDIEPEQGILRKKKQAKLDRIESEKLDFHKQVYEGYKTIASAYPQRIKVIEATDSEQNIHKNICDMLNKVLENN